MIQESFDSLKLMKTNRAYRYQIDIFFGIPEKFKIEYILVAPLNFVICIP